jgi:hypothetical protein
MLRGNAYEAPEYSILRTSPPEAASISYGRHGSPVATPAFPQICTLEVGESYQHLLQEPGPKKHSAAFTGQAILSFDSF